MKVSEFLEGYSGNVEVVSEEGSKLLGTIPSDSSLLELLSDFEIVRWKALKGGSNPSVQISINQDEDIDLKEDAELSNENNSEELNPEERGE